MKTIIETLKFITPDHVHAVEKRLDEIATELQSQVNNLPQTETSSSLSHIVYFNYAFAFDYLPLEKVSFLNEKESRGFYRKVVDGRKTKKRMLPFWQIDSRVGYQDVASLAEEQLNFTDYLRDNRDKCNDDFLRKHAFSKGDRDDFVAYVRTQCTEYLDLPATQRHAYQRDSVIVGIKRTIDFLQASKLYIGYSYAISEEKIQLESQRSRPGMTLP